MLEINGKKFMNLSEAVQWLLNNNALPFQSTANYVADTVIAKTTIVNPSPAEIRIGSLVLFADGKVGTVSGITDNGFMVGAESTDLSDGVPHITNIQLDASNHLIFTMSEGDPIDAGLVKMVSSLTINASQHLIVNYNDGTTTDLGAIFQGNINIAGNLTADSIVENMSGYTFNQASPATNLTREYVYAGVVKNGNKLTFVVALNITVTGALDAGDKGIGTFIVPVEVGNKLYPTNISGIDFLDVKEVPAVIDQSQISKINSYTLKRYSNNVEIDATYDSLSALTLNQKYYVRYEATFLLSDNLAA